MSILAPISVRPAVPSHRPPGFRVTLKEADASTRYANGDLDPGFRSDDRGPGNQCFQLIENKGGSRGLQPLAIVQAAIGPIPVDREPAGNRMPWRQEFSAFLPGVMLLTLTHAEEMAERGAASGDPFSLNVRLNVTASQRWLQK